MLKCNLVEISVNVDMQTCHPRREGWINFKVKRRKLPKHQVHLFFSGNEQLKIMILYIPILLLFLRI